MGVKEIQSESSGKVKAELGEERKAWVEAGRSCHKCGQV